MVIEDAQARLTVLLDIVRKVKNVRVTVHESYAVYPSLSSIDGVALPFEEVSRELLRFAGVGVTQDGSSVHADAVLEIHSEGHALSEVYAAPNERNSVSATSPRKRRFTGARLWGTVSLRTRSRDLVEEQFQATESHPYRIPPGKYENPGEAPFSTVFRSSFVPAMALMIGTLHGTDPLVSALKEGTHVARGGAAQALGEIGDPNSIKPLIIALEADPHMLVRGNAATALGKSGVISSIGDHGPQLLGR